ncbi:MAG TPA: peptidylprolyl isomerase [Polyangiaceae bacterium]|nr:peptidylprolyl isomerase [Polyangiaceae bacterium]
MKQSRTSAAARKHATATTLSPGLLAAILSLAVVLGCNKPAPPEHKPAAAKPAVSSAPKSDIAPPAPTAAPSAGAGSAIGPALAALLVDGKVPPLSDKAPKSVSFGVILFTYAGAEGARDSAPSRQAALDRALATMPQAQEDFAEAAKKGDPGSVANAGRMSRGVLEPLLEYALFTLDKGKTFPEPVDTPRGFWILRRID